MEHSNFEPRIVVPRDKELRALTQILKTAEISRYVLALPTGIEKCAGIRKPIVRRARFRRRADGLEPESRAPTTAGLSGAARA